jgi:hypothetical protein
MRRLTSILVIVLIVALRAPAAPAQSVPVPKTNSTKVYMHYMPWFQTPTSLGGTSGGWGYHWKMNSRNPNIVDSTGKRQIASHYYPKIGPYDSTDADVIEYHMLLLKYSGVDGVMVDWYGVQGSNGDVPSLLNASNAIVNQTNTYGLGFSVVMEDRFSRNIGDAQANMRYLRDNYFNKANYIRAGANDSPLLPIFGPITFETQSQWSQILPETGTDPEFLPLLYQGGDAGSNTDGEYAWPYQDANTSNHLSKLRSFYTSRAPQMGTVGGVAYPGFHDYYLQGGAGTGYFYIPENNGQTLADTLDLYNTYKINDNLNFLQLATFNDFGEGTMFEPTVETGFEYLKQIQQFAGVSYGEAELQLIYRLYTARKKYAGYAPIETMLDQVSTLLTELKVSDATDLLNSAAPAGDFNADGLVDTADYFVWRNAFGSSTILYGTGADGNFDGRVDAADFTVWRDNLVGAGSGSAASIVPEPTALVLSILAGVALCQRRIAQRYRAVRR